MLIQLGYLAKLLELSDWPMVTYREHSMANLVSINRNAHALYSNRTHSCRRPYNCYMEGSQGSHTPVTGSRTTVTWRVHWGHTEGGK